MKEEDVASWPLLVTKQGVVIVTSFALSHPFFNVLYVCVCVRVVLSITAVLSNKCGFQLQYQMIFCVWLLAFSPQLCEQLRRYNVVPALSDILQESVKEKVTRIILAAFRVRGKHFKHYFAASNLFSFYSMCHQFDSQFLWLYMSGWISEAPWIFAELSCILRLKCHIVPHHCSKIQSDTAINSKKIFPFLGLKMLWKMFCTVVGEIKLVAGELTALKHS